MKFKKCRFIFLGVLVILALVLVACGDDKPVGPPPFKPTINQTLDLNTGIWSATVDFDRPVEIKTVVQKFKKDQIVVLSEANAYNVTVQTFTSSGRTVTSVNGRDLGITDNTRAGIFVTVKPTSGPGDPVQVFYSFENSSFGCSTPAAPNS